MNYLAVVTYYKNMDEKTKITERNLTVSICLAHVVCLCWLIIFPLQAEACGWWGDGEHDDDDSVLVDTEERPVLDEDELIIDPAAQTKRGNLYKNGNGVAKDYVKAMHWYRKAAEQSHHGAFKDMGDIYWKGLGVPQNNILAYMWWRLGVLHGDKESERLLDIAAVKMNASRVAEAQKLAQEWMLKHK